MKIVQKQGRAIYGVDMKIVGGDGEELSWDGKVYGDLLVKGPWIVGSYFKGEGGDPLIGIRVAGAGSPRVTWPRLMPMASCRSLTAART